MGYPCLTSSRQSRSTIMLQTLYRDNGKYKETTILGYIGVYYYRGYIGIMENNMDTTVLGYIVV